MNIREPEKQILNDFEHKVTNKIKLYGNYPDFPKMEDYGIEGMELDDYGSPDKSGGKFFNSL